MEVIFDPGPAPLPLPFPLPASLSFSDPAGGESVNTFTPPFVSSSSSSSSNLPARCQQSNEKEIKANAHLPHVYQHYYHSPPSYRPLSRVRSNGSPSPTRLTLPLLRPTAKRITSPSPSQVSPTTPNPPSVQGSDYFATLYPGQYPQPRCYSPALLQPSLVRSPRRRRPSLDPEELLLTPPQPSHLSLCRTMSSASSSMHKRKVVIMGAPSVGKYPFFLSFFLD
jgi:hypothetical protein